MFKYMRQKYTTQKKVSLFDLIKVVSRRGFYFIGLKSRYLLDKCQSNRPKKVGYSELLIGKTSDVIDSWKQQLQEMRPVLDLFRLELDHSELLRRSDAIMQHRFFLLGKSFLSSKPEKASSLKFCSIPWHYDPGSGYQWSRKIWYKDARKNLPPGVDIKLPWELSRCQHFILLGEAYDLTQDERYAVEYRNQILDWIESNPVRYGPNWTCTMEVGIRIANWLVGLQYFYHSPSLNDLFYTNVLISIEEHGKHIISNLENISIFNSNHYLGNIAGLYFLAVLCPILKESKGWQKFAKNELEREIYKQTYDDGWDYESSTAYHRLVTEMFYYPFLLGRSIGDNFSNNYENRLKRMVKCIEYTTKPNSQLPQIGDNDSGRFLVFNCVLEPSSLNVDYTKNWMEFLLNEPQIEKTEKDSIVFEKGGRYIFRSDNIYFIITADKKDKYINNGHAHNDQLGFELNVFGEDIFVDSGTYTYTRNINERNLFRSVTNHNVLYWPDIESCSFNEGPFVLREKGALIIDKVKMGGLKEEFAGCYSYRNRFHRREIHFNKGQEEIFIKDTCSHPGAQLSFICGPKIEPKIGDQAFSAESVDVLFKGASKIEMVRGEYSPAYGEKISTAKIIVYLKNKEISTHIRISKSKIQ